MYGRILLALTLVLAIAAAPAATQAQSCTAKTRRSEVALPMGAFAMVEVPGTCQLLATLGTDDDKQGGLALIDLRDSKPVLVRTVPLATAAYGLVLSRDRRLALAAGGDRIYVFDVRALVAGKTSGLAATLKYADHPGTVSLAFTADEKLLFASDEQAGKITALDFFAMRKSGFSKPKVVASIAVDYAPTVLAASRDGRFLYVPVQGLLRRHNPPIACRSEGGKDPTPINPVGGILTVDVAKVRSDPDHAVVSRAYAGCSPVRLALSRDGRTMWVTNRLGDTVRAFDVAKLSADPQHSQIAIVNVGHQPIGVALLDGDRIVAVANACRWDCPEGPKTVSAFIAADALRGAGSPRSTEVGAFPRDLGASANGEALYVSNFGSKSISIIPASQLLKEAGQ
jgi:DNA-binding beta-propeller fold protein YncE